VAADRLVLADGTMIPANFNLLSCLGTDMLFVVLDLASRTLTQLPYDVPEADADVGAIRADAVSARVGWLSDGAVALENATRDVYEHVKANRVTAPLAGGWGDQSAQWADDAIASATPAPVQTVFITFNRKHPVFSAREKVAPYTHNVTLAGPESGKIKALRAPDDDGCSIDGLIAPDLASSLGLHMVRAVRIEGITPDEAVDTRVARISVTLAPNVSDIFEVAVYAPLRKKTNSDFLIGRPIVDLGKKHHVEGY
jgi:hypothetical protein